MEFEFDYTYWLPPKSDFAEEFGQIIYDKYQVTCYFEEIIHYFDYQNEKLRIGWLIRIPEELVKQFEEQEVWDEFEVFTKVKILEKRELGLRSFYVSKREIRLIYANAEDLSKYFNEEVINKLQ